jgi:hypothetical protein
VLFVPAQINRSGKDEIGPTPGFLAQTHSQNLKLVNAVESAGRVASCSAGLLGFDLVADDLPAGPISFSALFAALADILALRQQQPCALQPD